MADDAANALLDAHLLAYLHAYQEYTVLNIELQSILREGHIKLAQARRELSRTTSTSALSFGTTCVPSEFEALLRVSLAPQSDGQSDAPPVLELCESKGALAKEAHKASGGGLRNRRQGGATAGPDATLLNLNASPDDDRAPEHDGDEGSDAADDADDAVDFRAMLQAQLVQISACDSWLGPSSPNPSPGVKWPAPVLLLPRCYRSSGSTGRRWTRSPEHWRAAGRKASCAATRWLLRVPSPAPRRAARCARTSTSHLAAA